MLIEGCGKCTLRKEPVISPLRRQFKTAALGKPDELMNFICSYKNLLKNFIFFHFLLLEDYEQGALKKEPVLAAFIKWFKKLL